MELKRKSLGKSNFSKIILLNLPKPWAWCFSSKHTKLTREEKDYIFSNLQNNAYSRTGVPVLGWMFDFSEFLKSYWVKTRNYGILEVYAFDKTSIRNYYGSYEILKIVEID